MARKPPAKASPKSASKSRPQRSAKGTKTAAKPRQSRLPAAKRREQLLDCAAKLFAKSGYARATTAELAKAAGVTEPIIYRHFSSKRDLFVALIERAAHRTIQQWEDLLGNANDPAERLTVLLGENPMANEPGQSVYRVILQAITEVDDTAIQQAVSRHFFELHGFLTRELLRAQDDHKLGSRFSPEIVAWMLIDIALGYGVLDAMRIPGHGEDSARVRVQDVVRRILVGPRHEH